MPLSFGLNVRKKDGAAASSTSQPSKLSQSSVFGADDSDEESGDPTKQKPAKKSTSQSITVFNEEDKVNPTVSPSPKTSGPATGTHSQPTKKPSPYPPTKTPTNLSAQRTAQLHAEKDEAIDASIYDYDAAYDALHAASNARKAAAAQDAADKRPRYITNLISSAETRKKDQLRAQDKAIQREREAEGDEFADKEKFVTGAYREAQEEARRLEEEEKARAEQEALKRREQGMTSFYRGVMEQREKEHAEMVRMAAEMPKEAIAASAEQPTEKTDADIAAELNKQGRNIELNEEGQVTDKRELLSAGLNVIPKKPAAAASNDAKKADDARSKSQNQQSYEKRDARAAQRERQSRIIEQQMEAAEKRRAEEELKEEEERKKAAKSQKSETDITSARERFLARKREREAEAAKKNSG